VITDQQGSDGTRTAGRLRLSAQIHVAPTSPRQRHQRYFPKHTSLGRLNFTAPGNRPSLTNCTHARVGNVEDCEV
jgi:hypothetical protein